MSHDVIIGTDGRPRCAWAGDSDTPLGRYHDEVWGHRPYDQHAMFEALTLGVFQLASTSPTGTRTTGSVSGDFSNTFPRRAASQPRK